MNAFHKITIAILFCLVGALQISASKAVRKDSVVVSGVVKDLFDGTKLNKGRYTVYNDRDSVVYTDTLMQPQDAYWGTYKYQTDGGFNFKLPSAGNYKIRFDVDDYFPDMQPLNIPEKTFKKPTTIWEQNFKLRKIPQEKIIDGVVVRATRIKMVIKGDTVEYNADAFNLAEGSMLDKLIEAMPGMELRENGEIYNNGRKVESLLVNGKDFFNGDPKMALDNLPAYTVKSVQVYRKDADDSYLIRDSLSRDSRKRLVVDVKLKKEYSKGWMVNTDLAYGSSKRYFAKGFGMYYTDAFKLALYGNVNNLNDQTSVGTDGNWDGTTVGQGLHSIKSGGYALNYEHKLAADDEYFAVRSRGKISYVLDDNVTKESSARYLTGGDTYSRRQNISYNSRIAYNGGASMVMRKKRYFALFRPFELNYSRTKGNSRTLSATFNQEPQEAYRVASLDSVFEPIGSKRLESMLLNTVKDVSHSISTNFDALASFYTRFHSPIFGNDMSISLEGTYGKNENENFQHYWMKNYQDPTKNERQNVYMLRPGRNYYYKGELTYSMNPVEKFELGLGYSYHQQYNRNNSSRYRLDSLSGWELKDDSGLSKDNPELGTLPSNRESMRQAMDTKNSYYTSTLDRANRLAADVRFSLAKHWQIMTNLPLNFENHNISDQRDYTLPPDPLRAKRHQVLSSNGVMFNPTANLTYWKDKSGVITLFQLDYSHSESMPSLNNMLDTEDSTNPLFKSIGNPNLKNQRNNALTTRFWHSNAKHMQNYGASLSWNVMENRIATATSYDRATTVTTYQPCNINGNWSSNLDLNFERFIDRNDHLKLRLRLNEGYDHNVDYITDYAGDVPAPSRSTVHNYISRQEGQLTWTYKKTKVEFFENVRWWRQLSNRDNFNSVSAFDINYGLRSNGPIVWGVEYDMLLSMKSRRGYNDASMNTDDLVCNFSLSKSLLKGKPLTLRLEVHDAFAQLKNTRNVINAQGRTETWYNAIPRYAMFHVVYKFNAMGKKKQKPVTIE